MTDIAKQIKKDLFSANRRIARLEAFIKSVHLGCLRDESKRKEILKEKW